MAAWRPWAVALAVVSTAAIVWPAVHDEDGFPLSNYPMFSHPKGTTAKIYHAVGFTSDGRGMPLSPEMVGTDEIMQAYQSVKLSIHGGRARALCEAVAGRVSTSPTFSEVVRVEVRVDVFDAVRYWEGDRSTDRSSILAKCGVSR